jgi:AcrR family transcriptional regulator
MRNSAAKKPILNRRAAEAVARQQQLLRAADELFTSKGYRNTSLSDIVARAGGSRETLAKYFGNKAGLFAAIIEKGATEFVAHADFAKFRGTPEAVLREYGTLTLKFFLRPAALHVYRDVVGESTHAPDIATAFYRTGFRRLIGLLTSQLADWSAQHLIDTPDPEGDAELFIHLLRAGLHEQVLLGLRGRPTRAEIRATVDNTVRVFFRGIDRRTKR